MNTAKTEDNKIQCLEVKVYPWEDNRYFSPGDQEVKVDDWVIVNTENGQEIAKVMAINFINKDKLDENLPVIEKVADLEDLKKLKDQQSQKKQALKVCKQFIHKHDLPMKLVDCVFTFDNKKIIFAFTAETRVDFRSLVKDLISHFKKAIRLQQIGIRDEFKQIHTIGPCGRETCCASFLKELGNITTDLARLQQVQQRGSDRLSGACGRLKCCLNYEAEGYREYSQNLPPIDSIIKTDQGKGRVIEWNVIKHSVLVRIDEETVVEKFFGCRYCNCSGCQANKYYQKQRQ